MKKICYILILSTAFILKAQSIDSLVSLAENHHPEFLAVKAKIEAAKAKAQSVDIYPSPTVALEISQIPYGTWDIVNKANMNTLIVSQMFMPGGKVKAMVKAEESQISVIEQQYESLLRQFRYKIVNHYIKIWEIEQKSNLIREENLLLEKMDKNLTSRLSYSSFNSGELLLLKLQQSENLNKLLNFDNDKQAQLFMLLNVVGKHSEENNDFKFIMPEQDSLTISLNELKSALTTNPDLQAMDKMSEMINLEQIAKNKEQIPDFMLSAMFMRMPNGMFVTENMAMEVGPEMHIQKTGSAYMYGLMFSFNLPFVWWHNDQYTYQKKNSEFEQKSTLLSKNSMQYQMFNELGEIYLKQKSVWRNIVFYRKNIVNTYKESISNQIEQLSSNQSDLKMILDMEKMLLMQKMNYIMSQGEFYMILNELEQMSGKRLLKL